VAVTRSARSLAKRLPPWESEAWRAASYATVFRDEATGESRPVLYESLRERLGSLGFVPTARVGSEESRSFEVLLERPTSTSSSESARDLLMPGGTSSVVVAAILFGLYSLLWLAVSGPILGNPWREFGVVIGPVVVALVWLAAWTRRYVKTEALRVRFEFTDDKSVAASNSRIEIGSTGYFGGPRVEG
jgi:hypothetical protein